MSLGIIVTFVFLAAEPLFAYLVRTETWNRYPMHRMIDTHDYVFLYLHRYLQKDQYHRHPPTTCNLGFYAAIAQKQEIYVYLPISHSKIPQKFSGNKTMTFLCSFSVELPCILGTASWVPGMLESPCLSPLCNLP
jgi:hypothetical protein